MARRTKEEAEQTRSRILEAALNIFYRKGYSHTTFVDIAREIGLTKGAVYWHFKSKPDLLVAMIAHERGKHLPALDATQPSSLLELRNILMKHAKMVSRSKAARKFEFFSHFQIEWSEELMTMVHEKLSESRNSPKRTIAKALAHLQEIGELRREADLKRMCMALFAMWTGALQLLLRKICNAKQFCALLEHHFDLVVGQYAAQPIS